MAPSHVSILSLLGWTMLVWNRANEGASPTCFFETPMLPTAWYNAPALLKITLEGIVDGKASSWIFTGYNVE